MRKPHLLASALLLSLLAACLVYVPEQPPLPEADPSLLVSAAQLRDRLDDPRTVVVHVGRDRTSYDQGHVPGAQFLPLSAIVTERDGLPNELPAVEQLDAAFEAVGVGDDTRVVLYGDLNGLLAARAFFTLDYLGLTPALLDGGMDAWRARGFPVSTEPAPQRRGALTPRPNPQLLVDADWVRAHLGDSTVVFVDARPAAEFTGEVPGDGVDRPGHIPGAVSIPWSTALISSADPRLRSPEVLTAAYTLADIERGDTIVAYCRTGVQASFAYFVARYLKHPARMYDGSFIDWSRRGEAYPVER